jgi:TolB-like protein/Tfp pilus assembly protein PilF
MSLITELKRRNVFRVGAAYGIVGWLLVEIASVLLPTFGAPEWVMKAFSFLVILGFPLALILAWAFELTPEGIKRETDVDPAESITHSTGRKLDFAIIALLAVALTYVVIDNYVLEAEPESVNTLTQAEDAPGITKQAPGAEPGTSEKSVAVLPFANRSIKAEDAFFVDGMHDDILTHLAKIRSLKVISRTSVMEYRDTEKNMKTIGRELGASNILEGGVQRSGNHVRINVQLIDAETDDHLWAEIFDRQLTAENLFSIQTEIATAIADALQAALSPEERDRLAAVPTENLEAYEAYLIGRQRLADRSTGAFVKAVEYFEKAIRLDSDFALAYVGLAETYVLQAFYSGLPPKETLEKARVAAEQALKLDDQLGEAYNALGAVKEDTHDYEGAEAAFKRALELSPNHAPTYHWYGFMLRHELGRPEEALALHRRAHELDPLSGSIMVNLAGDLNALGRYDEAMEWVEKGIEIVPGYAGNYETLGGCHWLINGRLDEAIVAYAKALSLDPENTVFLANAGSAYLDLGDPVAAEQFIDRSIELGPETPYPNLMMQLLHLYRGEETRALEYARRAFALRPYSFFFNAALGFLRDHELRAGRTEQARALYAESYPELLNERDPMVDRRNYIAAIGLALVLSRAGEQQHADLLLDRSLERIRTIPRLSLFGYGLADVRIHAIRGDRQEALSALRQAVDAGWRGQWWYQLERDLSLEPLHDEPEYQAMVVEIKADMAVQLERVRELERNGELAPIPAS